MQNEYEPIENYGAIGDLHTIALVGISGSIDFMCFPNYDSPTVFARLLDKDRGGFFQISSCEKNVKTKQLYLPETNILLTRFLLEDGIGEVTDFMPIASLYKRNMLIRKVINIKGKIRYRMECSPRFNYGKDKHHATLKEKAIIFRSDRKEGVILKLSSSVALEMNKGDGFAEFTLNPGESAEFLLENIQNEQNEIAFSKDFIDSTLTSTINYWKKWTGQSTYNGRWREMVIRSALTLKLMISEDYGSIIAAPTFGLPEKIGGSKNWDYRFVWIRDAAFTIYSLLSIGYKNEADQFRKWIKKLLEHLYPKTHLQPLYRINGNSHLPLKKIPFEGYKGSHPVFIGNIATDQLQLDIYGEFLDCLYLSDKYVEPLSYETWVCINHQINWLCNHWDKKDYSIWETQGKTQKFLFSRLMCWVAMDRAIKIASSRSFPYPQSWRKVRDKIFLSIYQDFWNEKKGAFVQAKGSKHVDASCLLMPLVRFIGPKDQRWLSTLKVIEDELTTDCMVYRYNPTISTLFGLKKGEGTFSACSFWYVECLSRAGQLQKAELYFDKLLSYANHLGLYSEQLGFQGEQLGNFPQAFTHLSLISAAFDLNKRLEGSLKA